MKKIVIASFYLLLIVVLCVATFLERAYGTDWIHDNVYSATWFVFLWAVIAVGLLFAVVKRRMWRGNRPLCLLHMSVVVILLGGFITWLSGESGIIHLRQGVVENEYIVDDEHYTRRALPFSLSLDSFYVKHYAGTSTPSDFVSCVTTTDAVYHVSTKETISMNNILRHKGYRFYQTSFDEDGKGSILSVNHDPYGIAVTYFGYFFFAFSFLLVIKEKSSLLTFQSSLSKVGHFSPVAILLFVLMPVDIHAQKNVMAHEEAEKLVTKQIVYHNRIVPFNTMALDIVRKLYGKDKYHSLSAEQVVGSLVLYPEQWDNERLIKVKSEKLMKKLNVDGKYVSVNDLYDSDGTYKLQKWWSPDRKDKLHEAIAETDEKVALIAMLRAGRLFRPVAGVNHRSPVVSDAKIRAEVFYNNLNFISVMFKVNLTAGLIVFVFLVVGLVRQRDFRAVRLVAYVLVCLSFAVVLLAFALRWYVAGYMPMTNGYETMMSVALFVLLVTIVLTRRTMSLLLLSGGLLLSGFVLLVSDLSGMNPQITSLMPVLASPWLTSHVSLMMISYALFAITFFVSLTALIITLCRRNAPSPCFLSSQLSSLNDALLLPAVAFLGCGIWLGAVWANVSWGSYWSWDAKEVWALVTMMVYGGMLHWKSFAGSRHVILYHIMVICCFLVLLMTYFGVNILFDGMHSYK